MSLLLFIYLAYQSHTALGTPTASSSSSSSDPNPLTHLIYGCFATVFATSWAAVHPNIPAQNSTWAKRAALRAEMMAWTVVAPEIVVMLALHQWIAARQLAARYRDRGWTTTHGFFLQMGGFVLQDGPTTTGVLSPHRFNILIWLGNIAFPEVTLQEINARSQPDALACGAAVLQMLWFVAQLGMKLKARGREGVLQLEFATLAVTILNAFVFAFWWAKPRDVRVPVEVRLVQPTPPAEPGTDTQSSHSSAPINKTRKSIILDYILSRLLIFVGHNDYDLLAQPSVPTFFASHIPRTTHVRAYFATTLLGLAFGAIHCAAWDLSFPSNAERVLWRVASVVMVAYLTLFLLLLLPELVWGEVVGGQGVQRVPTKVDAWMKWFELAVLWGVCAPIYVAARLFVIMEVFLVLRVQGGVGAASWTGALPHL